MSNIDIDDIIDNMMSEDVKTLTDFLGYEPSDESLNSEQLLREELENVAKQMPDEELIKFNKQSQQKAMQSEIEAYNARETDRLLKIMKEYASEMSNQADLQPIVAIINNTIVKIEKLQNN